MATLNVTKTWSADEVLTHTDLNNNFQDVEDFINGANLDTDNISTKYATVAYVLSLSGVVQGQTYTYKIKLPSGSAPVGSVICKTISVQAERTAGRLTVNVMNGSDVKMSAYTEGTAVVSNETILHAGAFAPNDELTIQVIADGSYAITANTIPTVAFHALTEIRSS